MGARNATLVSGNSAVWERAVIPPCCIQTLAKNWLPNAKSAAYFFFLAFAVFFAAGFDFFFFMAIWLVSLMVPQMIARERTSHPICVGSHPL